MDRRVLLGLGAAALASVGGALLLGQQRPQEGVATGGLAFEGLAARLASAQRIEVRKPDAALVLDRRGEAWVLPEKGGYPVRAERVRELLVGLTELRLVEPRTSDSGQLDRLGVDDPARPGSTALLLRVLDGAGAPLAELVVGRRRVRTQGNVPESVYVRRPAESQAWLAEGRLPADADPQLWLDRDVANLPGDRVRRVTVHRAGEAELVLARPEEPDAKLRIAEPADAPAPDEVSLDEVARAFEFLTFLDVAKEAPGDPVGEGHFDLDGGLRVNAHVHRAGDAVWVMLQAEGDGEEAARLNARWSGWAFQVGAWKEKAFAPRLGDLLPRERPPG